ncbi:HEPN domain-containing protein [Candidatus Parcubacteria bacterium]|nr:HEPN domain-containing protein [Candidatus Parcubacteria bacterium]
MTTIYQKLIDNGLLKQEQIGFNQVNKVLDRAYKNIKSAKTLLKDDDEEGSFQFAYEAMLLAGRALVFSYSLRPRAVGSHKIVIDFTEKIIGKEYKIFVQKFDKMRRKRNYLIYGVGLMISETEAENAIKTAEEFMERIKEIIHKKNPQTILI